MTKPLRIFIAYAHADAVLRDALENHLATLKRLGHIAAWTDRCILPGDVVVTAIDRALQRANVILLLVSADFLASDYCHGLEVTRALQRWKTGAARVLPVILRPCDWQDSPFGHLLAAPADGKPVTTWRSRDAAWVDVVRSIRSLRTAWVPSQVRPIRPSAKATDR
jgi:hypothetical protein